MPILKIQVNEYQCIRCHYKWINRVNGNDGPIPKRCARCKTLRWDIKPMTPLEKGLRRRIKGLKLLYQIEELNWIKSGLSIVESWSDELVEEFLNQRPTIAELKQVLYPLGLVIEPLISENQYRNIGYVPDPDKPGRLKYDPEEYKKNRKLEAQERQQIMRQIIEKRKA